MRLDSKEQALPTLAGGTTAAVFGLGILAAFAWAPLASGQCAPSVIDIRMSVPTPQTGPYLLNQVSRPPITLVEGQAYTFNLPATVSWAVPNWSVPSGHPMVMTTDPDGGSPPNSGTAQLTPAQLPGYTFGSHCTSACGGTGGNTFTCIPGPTTPSVFYYQCTSHVNLGGQVTVLRRPVINTQPVSATTCFGSGASFTVAATLSEGTLTYQWRRNAINLTGGSSNSPTLTIDAVTGTDLGTYDCVVSNQCAIVVSSPATLASCPADIANSLGQAGCDGGVDINDLLYFLDRFEAGDAEVDFDDGSGTGTPDDGVDISDLLYYLARFEAGC
jgi:Immunoglobulin domain